LKLPRMSRFEYLDCSRTLPGMSRACPFSFSKLPLQVWGPGPHLIHTHMVPCTHPSQYPERHFDSFSRFCMAHDRDIPTDRQTDHATPSVAIARIYVALRGGLIIPINVRQRVCYPRRSTSIYVDAPDFMVVSNIITNIYWEAISIVLDNKRPRARHGELTIRIHWQWRIKLRVSKGKGGLGGLDSSVRTKPLVQVKC